MKRGHGQMEADAPPPSNSLASHVDLLVDDQNPPPPTKAPKISRKVHACTECQTRKIKCDLGPPARPVCTRCSRKGLRCVVNKSLQSLLEEGTEWKTSMEEQAKCLHLAVSKILSVLELPPLESFSPKAHSARSLTPTTFESSEHMIGSRGPQRGMAMTRENSQEVETNKMDDTPISDPMGALYEVTKLRNLRSNLEGRIHAPVPTLMEEDFIAKGKIAETEAQELFETFSRSFNHYLWGGVALLHDTLTSVRQSSTLLLAAILSVTALHIPGRERTFDIAYAEFTSLVCESMLDRYHTLDGIRGLCIGAFWLSDVSWKLSGHAVRIATELNLHQSYSRAMRGSREHFEGARLWYFLYVCDHHFSIAYGRPPVIHEDEAITNHEKFLELPGISQADLRLHSQVAVFIILTGVYNAFGPDSQKMLTEEDLLRLRHFNVSLDSWRIAWEPRLAPNIYISSYPSKGVSLHHNFAKLQANSLALRGIQQRSVQDLTPARRELANTAVDCAMSILQIVLDEPDIRQSLVGVPIYLHTMITYAAVFLLKVQQKWKSFNLRTDQFLIRDLITRMINLLTEARAGERHLTRHIAMGLSKILERFSVWESHGQNVPISDVGQMGQHAGPGSIQKMMNPIVQDNAEFDAIGMYNDLPLYDEQYFPLGFFDIMSPFQLGVQGEFYQNGARRAL